MLLRFHGCRFPVIARRHNVIADLLLLYQQALSIDAALGAPLDPGWNVTGLILCCCEFVCTAAIFYPEGTS